MEEKSKLEGLKQFQKETVKSVIDRFYDKENPQTRVLVADEVGLGKTMIARGVLAEVYEKEKHNSENFKVIYICFCILIIIVIYRWLCSYIGNSII